MQRTFSAKSLSLALLFLLAPNVFAQSTPLDVSYCDLATNPKSYDGKTIQVRGTLSVNFEDFSLYSSGCKSDQGIWLTFGGDVPGIVTSTVNDIDRVPGKNLTVTGVSYAVKKDESFRRLYALISTQRAISRFIRPPPH